MEMPNIKGTGNMVKLELEESRSIVETLSILLYNINVNLDIVHNTARKQNDGDLWQC